jgi:predicted AAA+ superfamily ATPase
MDLQNPWWFGRAQRPIPTFQRWPFRLLRDRLIGGRHLAPVQVLRGPRQIGKTTLQEQLIEELLATGVHPDRILRVQFDELDSLKRSAKSGDPILDLARWFERERFPGADFNAGARRNEPAFLFFDEVQNLHNWATQLKSLVDHASVRVCVTGSSALRIKRGQDSLAGRLQPLEAGPLRLTEIAAVRHFGELKPFEDNNGYTHWANPSFWHALRDHGVQNAELRDRAFAAFADRGGYPLAQREGANWAEISSQLNEVIVERVIEHDLRIGERGLKRDPKLLRELFRICSRLTGQAPTRSKIIGLLNQTLNANIGDQRVRNYLDFLDDSLLVRLVEPLSISLKKRAEPDKICLSDHGLRAAWLGESVPLAGPVSTASPAGQDIAGRVAESIVGAYLCSMTGLEINHIPERTGPKAQREVDFVITVGGARIPIEVKYQSTLDPVRDTAGLRQFIDNSSYHASIGLLIHRDDQPDFQPDPRIIAIPLKTFLLLR